MRKRLVMIFMAVLALRSAVSTAFAQTPAGRPSLESAYGEARVLAAAAAAREREPSDDFPKPDDQTLKMLAKRIPGLKTESVRTVPFEAADAFLAKAAASGLTFLDVLTARGPGPDRVYCVTGEVLSRLDQRYETGAWPVSGTVVKPSNGGTFKMAAVAAGPGWTKVLYDRGGFRYKDGDDEVEVGSAGIIAIQPKGPGAIGLQGLKGCGCLGPFCGCAELQGMRKVSPSAMKVDTDRGEQDAKLGPIRAK